MALKTEARPDGRPNDSQASVNRLALGAGVSLVGVVMGRGLEFVKQVALARLLGIEAFGLYALGWNLLRSIGILLPLGLQSGVMHFGSGFWRKDDGALRSIMTRAIGYSFLIGCVVATILFLIAPWLTTTVFNEPEFTTAFRVFTLMLPFMGALRVAANATRISQRMQFSVAAEEIFQSILNLALFVALYLLGWQLMGAVVSTVLSYVAAFGLAVYFVRRLFTAAFQAPPRPAISRRRMFAFSAPASLAEMSGVVINRADRLFLGVYWPSADVGVYQAAAQVAVIMAAILGAFNMIFMPMIADHFHRRDMKQLEELFRINTKWGIYCITPLVLVIAFAAEDVMRVVFGAAYAGGATVLLILTIGQFINIATGGTGAILVMTGRQTLWLRLSLCILVANLVLNLTLVPRWGMIGAAVATALTVGGLFTIGLLIVQRTVHLWPYDRRYLKGIGAALGTAALLFGVRLLGLPPLSNLLLTTAVAAAGFFGLLLLLGLDPEDRAFIQLLLKRVRVR